MDFPEDGASLNKLLQWSISHSDPEKLASTPPAGPGELDPKWLEAMFPDEAKKMKAALVIVANSELELEDREKAMDDLLFMCENIDAAADLPKVDGIAPLLLLLQDPESPHSLRAGAAWVLSTASQNNPYTQKAALNRHAEAIAVTQLDACLTIAAGTENNTANANALAKKLFGVVSSLVDHEDGGPAFAALPDQAGFAVIARALEVGGNAGVAHRATVLATKLLALPVRPDPVLPATLSARIPALLAALWQEPTLVLSDNVALAEAALRFFATLAPDAADHAAACRAALSAKLGALQNTDEYDADVVSDVVRLLTQTVH